MPDRRHVYGRGGVVRSAEAPKIRLGDRATLGRVTVELSHDLFRADRVRMLVRSQADSSTEGVVAASIEVANA